MKVNIEMLAAIYKLGTAVVCADENVDPVCAKPLTAFFYSINGFNDEAMQRVADYANKNESMTVQRVVERFPTLMLMPRRRLSMSWQILFARSRLCQRTSSSCLMVSEVSVVFQSLMCRWQIIRRMLSRRHSSLQRQMALPIRSRVRLKTGAGWMPI